ncbi:hypothetical protein BDP55DRAFT_251977 [Colletotrichum godetiae]|uniref:Uncharacterized protein n=1 Tax=Colletotrichum godetiae TaxID=1209918 RepID=A0AAJ0ESN4_9PEZI|nr:uncharacterized protein BDP55DRAFT_251977 [Colletotrichum godetiae]KAK1672488.1 hypothetical protein BDP55DRAFT_251977 [Colletotrichum godetiae]
MDRRCISITYTIPKGTDPSTQWYVRCQVPRLFFPLFLAVDGRHSTKKGKELSAGWACGYWCQDLVNRVSLLLVHGVVRVVLKFLCANPMKLGKPAMRKGKHESVQSQSTMTWFSLQVGGRAQWLSEVFLKGRWAVILSHRLAFHLCSIFPVPAPSRQDDSGRWMETHEFQEELDSGALTVTSGATGHARIRRRSEQPHHLTQVTSDQTHGRRIHCHEVRLSVPSILGPAATDWAR